MRWPTLDQDERFPREDPPPSFSPLLFIPDPPNVPAWVWALAAWYRQHRPLLCMTFLISLVIYTAGQITTLVAERVLR